MMRRYTIHLGKYYRPVKTYTRKYNTDLRVSGFVIFR